MGFPTQEALNRAAIHLSEGHLKRRIVLELGAIDDPGGSSRWQRVIILMDCQTLGLACLLDVGFTSVLEVMDAFNVSILKIKIY